VCCLALAFGAEAFMSRNYWLGTVCVTPMALLVTELARPQRAADLVTGRVMDTLVGAVLGLAAALVVTNRRAATRTERALTALETAAAGTDRLLDAPDPCPADLERARRRLAAALVDLRTAADTAAGEWWPATRPEEERLALAEQTGHRTLARTVQRQGLHPLTAPGAPGPYPVEDARR
jgi:uncharacterized membrane protein YccC